MDQRKIYWCKNGRRFSNSLIRAADDGQATKMFCDNMVRYWQPRDMLEMAIDRLSAIIQTGDFKLALYKAFDWKYSHEKEDFWYEVHRNINNLN